MSDTEKSGGLLTPRFDGRWHWRSVRVSDPMLFNVHPPIPESKCNKRINELKWGGDLIAVFHLQYLIFAFGLTHDILIYEGAAG